VSEGRRVQRAVVQRGHPAPALGRVGAAHRHPLPGVMRTVDEHRRVVAGLISARPAATLPLADTLGLVLAADVAAPLSLPGFDNSAMDGYAVLADDVAGASAENPVRLPVVEDIPAGRTDIP